jgi:hypothetical protein
MSHIPCLLELIFFGPSKLCYPPLAHGKKTFLLTLNVMILQTVRHEHARLGGHVVIEVSYKILQLEIRNEAPILLNSPCFQ